LAYFTGQNRPHKKWASVSIFKPAKPQPMGCLLF